MFGSKRREIERLRRRVADLCDDYAERGIELGAARNAEKRAAELFDLADTHLTIARTEADALSAALLAEHGRAELLADAVFVALGYPEGAIAARQPEVTR